MNSEELKNAFLKGLISQFEVLELLKLIELKIIHKIEETKDLDYAIALHSIKDTISWFEQKKLK